MDILTDRINRRNLPKKQAPQTGCKTIIDLLHTYYHTQMNGLSHATLKQYKVAFKKYLPNDLPLSQPELIRDMIWQIFTQSTTAKNTEWKRLQRIRKLFQFGVDEGFIDKNPITKSMVPKYENKPVRTFTPGELRLIIQNLPADAEISHFVKLAIRTAMRIGELINLKWTDIYADYIVIDGKTGKRIFPLKPFPAIRRQLSAIKHINSGLKVFAWTNQQSPARLFRVLLQDLGIEGKTFHTLRKTTINNWREKGYDTELRTLLAGHDLATQKEFYLDSPDLRYFDNKFEKLTGI